MHNQGSDTRSIEEVAAETAMEVAQASERRSWLSITALSGVIFGLVGFYDPAKDLYNQFTDSVYQNGPPVKVADYQRQLWAKNSDCVATLTMQEAALNGDVSIRAGACPNKDVLVQVFPKNSFAVSNWITAVHGKASATANMFSAFAASMEPLASDTGGTVLKPVQLSISTVCQGWADPARKSKLIRIVSENGTCFKEITNVYSGQVVYRETVPCNAPCK